MQYAVTHKWLQRLTHTNIHISTEEDIPQGRDGAICVMQSEHKENRTKQISSKVENNKYMTTFRRSNASFNLDAHIPLDMGTARWSAVFQPPV